MGEIILLLIVVVLAIKGDYTLFYIFGGVFVIAVMDTLMAHRDHCVGMAANMIGVHKRIIAVFNGPFAAVMFNPKILSKFGEYEAEEGCLSLAGVRKVKRWKSIRLQWQDAKMKEHVALLDGFQAQIVQHEIDHCDGILI